MQIFEHTDNWIIKEGGKNIIIFRNKREQLSLMMQNNIECPLYEHFIKAYEEIMRLRDDAESLFYWQSFDTSLQMLWDHLHDVQLTQS